MCHVRHQTWNGPPKILSVSSAGKGAIYILAEKETIPPDDSEKSDGGSWR